MKIYLVTAEHFSVPGLVQKAFATMALADAEAVDLVTIMLDGTDCDEKPEPVTVETWSDAVAWLEDYHGAAHCYVDLIELPLQEMEG